MSAQQEESEMAWSRPQPLLSVAEAAEVIHVSPRRVRALLASGSIQGRRGEHGDWLVERASLAEWKALRGEPVRPLSRSSLRLLADAYALDHQEPPSPSWEGASSRDRARARERLCRVKEAPSPVRLLRSWARHRSREKVVFGVGHGSEELLALPGVHASGISHPLARMAPSREVELHASPEALRRLASMPRGDVKVLAHPSREWSVGDVVIDLVAHGGAREDAAAERLLVSAR